MARRTKILLGMVVAQVAAIGAFAVPAFAYANCDTGIPNCYKTWESGIGGINVNGRIRIQGSYSDAGRHALRGYQRFQRDSGPALDTGRLYTSSSTSNSDPIIRERTDTVTDSLLWGDAYVTRYYYGFEWRSGGGGGCIVIC